MTWQRRAKHKASGKRAQSCHSTSPPPPQCITKEAIWTRKSRELRSSLCSRICSLIPWLPHSDLNTETTFKNSNFKVECHILSVASCVLGFHSCRASLSGEVGKVSQMESRGIRGDCQLRVLRDPDRIEPRGCKRAVCTAEMPRPWWYFQQYKESEYSYHLTPASPVLPEMSIILIKEVQRGRRTVDLCSDCCTNKVEKWNRKGNSGCLMILLVLWTN